VRGRNLASTEIVRAKKNGIGDMFQGTKFEFWNVETEFTIAVSRGDMDYTTNLFSV
jgi:hypothetical protein